jgi:anti-anti-sigma regulatory factor
MSVKFRKEPSGEGVISVYGHFDFASLEDFTRAYQAGGADTREWIIDMAATHYLDSSALGMLLIFRDHAGGDDSKIRIINCNEHVRRALMSFDAIFDISAARAI